MNNIVGNKNGLNLKLMVVIVSALFIPISTFIQVSNNSMEYVWITLAIFVFGIVLWFTNIIHPVVTGMTIIVLFSFFGILTFEEAVSGLGKEIIWLVISILFIGVAVEKTNLDKRISYSLLVLSKGNVKLTVLSLIFIAFLLTFFMPNGVGRVAVMLSIGMAIIQSLKGQYGENLEKKIMLTITYAPYITSTAVITGASGSIYAIGLFDSMLGFQWSYIHWAIIMLPICLCVLIIFWIILIFLFPTQLKVIEGGQLIFEQELIKIGPIKTAEKKLIILYTVLLLLWLSKEWHGITTEMSALLITILFFIPGIDLLDWKEDVKKVNWDIPILFTSGFAIAAAFKSSNLVEWLSLSMLESLSNLPTIFLVLSLLVILILIRLIFTNLNTMVASLMPIVLTFANGTPYNPVWIGMFCLLACSTSYILPTQTIGSMITYPMGYYSSKDMFIVGFLLTLTTIVVTTIFSIYIWPGLGLVIHM